MAPNLTAEEFVKRLTALGSPEKQASYQRSFTHGTADQFVGAPMRDVFALAKEFIEMPLSEIEKLLQSPIHEARAGALSVMDKQARRKGTSDEHRAELFRLYLSRMDRINDWDLVDIGAPYVIGRYLYERPRDTLYKFARSKNPWERRTAIVSTLYFVRQGDVDDTFRIAALLVGDEHELVQKPTGGPLREAGKVNRAALLRFLDEHAERMAGAALRNATEHLGAEERDRYLSRSTR